MARTVEVLGSTRRSDRAQPVVAPGPIVETTGLTRRFGSLVAVDAVSLAVNGGESFGLLGPNGAGKTTAIKMLITLLPPTEGSATVAGFDVVRRASEVRRSIGYVPQLISVDGELTATENLALFARLYDVPRAEREERVRAAIRWAGLEGAADRLVRTFSGGMLRRLEISRATLHRPRVLFLDEPSLGLDPLARETVWDRLAELRRISGTTVFLTTHFMDEADALCDRVAIMHRGRLAACGSPAELKAGLRRPGATLQDVFERYAGELLDEAETLCDVARVRRTAGRLG